MKTPSRLSLAAVTSLVCAVAQAQVKTDDPWFRAFVAGQKASGAFIKLQSNKTSGVVEARSPVAGVVEIHEMAMDGGVMKMRAIPSLDLVAGKPVERKPCGYHVMPMAPKNQVKPGGEVPPTPVFEGSDGKKQARAMIEVQLKAA